MKAIVINSCNEWQEYSSFRLIGVFTNRQHLDKALRKLIKEDVIEFNGVSVKEMSINELQDNCTYINFREITLNKIE